MSSTGVRLLSCNVDASYLEYALLINVFVRVFVCSAFVNGNVRLACCQIMAFPIATACFQPQKVTYVCDTECIACEFSNAAVFM